MHTLPATIIRVLQQFAPVFSARVWRHACVLVVRALLSPGRRTVAAALRTTGHADEPHFQTFHHVLNRAQ